jgi:thioredoxin 1
MKIVIFVVFMLSIFISAFAVENKSAALAVVENLYMGLSSGPLANAEVGTLPKDILISVGKSTVKESQLAARIAESRPDMQAMLKKNGFYLVEQMTVNLLLAAEAREWAKLTKRNIAKESEKILINAYFTAITDKVTVADTEMKIFYEENKDMVGDAKYDEVADDIKSYLLEQKKQEAVDKHINSISNRHKIKVNAEWLKKQAEVMLNNPVDKARRSGKPFMAEFGADGCRPCEMMAPIIEELRETYKDRCEILFVHTRENPILAGRYNIDVIPIQIFFDKDGKAVYRHTGFFAKNKIIEQLEKLGVK